MFIYGINLSLAAASFALMGWYVYFKGDLISPAVSRAERRRELADGRSIGAVVYLGAALIATGTLRRSRSSCFLDPAVRVGRAEAPRPWRRATPD